MNELSEKLGDQLVNLIFQTNQFCLKTVQFSFQFQFKFSELKDKIVLIENTASLWGTTVRDFTQMNELSEKFGDQLVILAFFY